MYESNNDVRFLSVKDVCKITSLSRTMITKLRNAGDFPPAVALGERRVVWPANEIVEWMRQRAKRRVR